MLFIFYGIVIFTYIHPSAKKSFVLDKAVSIFYTIITPFLNPIIYSLRNKEMKAALKKTLRGQGKSFCKGNVSLISLN